MAPAAQHANQPTTHAPVHMFLLIIILSVLGSILLLCILSGIVLPVFIRFYQRRMPTTPIEKGTDVGTAPAKNKNWVPKHEHNVSDGRVPLLTAEAPSPRSSTDLPERKPHYRLVSANREPQPVDHVLGLYRPSFDDGRSQYTDDVSGGIKHHLTLPLSSPSTSAGTSLMIQPKDSNLTPLSIPESVTPKQNTPDSNPPQVPDRDATASPLSAASSVSVYSQPSQAHFNQESTQAAQPPQQIDLVASPIEEEHESEPREDAAVGQFAQCSDTETVGLMLKDRARSSRQRGVRPKGQRQQGKIEKSRSSTYVPFIERTGSIQPCTLSPTVERQDR
ncbi:hypothetical protein AX17_006138 [Amanita inopinata Kibby_2008]|nr:hypothetical protein AX17_006138 [Amanita inopinata Kibby_2008]